MSMIRGLVLCNAHHTDSSQSYRSHYLVLGIEQQLEFQFSSRDNLTSLGLASGTSFGVEGITELSQSYQICKGKMHWSNSTPGDSLKISHISLQIFVVKHSSMSLCHGGEFHNSQTTPGIKGNPYKMRTLPFSIKRFTSHHGIAMVDSYQLRELGKSNNHPSSEVLQINSNNHLPLDVTSIDNVRRRLTQRHIQMIAIAGTLGTGLFLGSGEAINRAGPLGALIAFSLVGSVAYASLCSLGEMTSLAPVSGTFPHFASRWVDPALGFAVGWNYFLTTAFTMPAEISGARLLISYWDPGHAWLYTLIICSLMCAANIFGVVYFAETEFIFSVVKLIMIIGLIIVGLLIDLGGLPNQHPIGFNFWKNPGPFVASASSSALEPQHPALDNFLGILSVIVQAAFSYQGMEIVAIAASETKNPRRNIPKAIRRTFYRILIFYILGIFVAGLIVSSVDENLLSASPQLSSTATQSPFVIAIKHANIKVLPSIVTAGMLTSAISAGNSFMFCSSRILYGLAIRGQAPRVLTFCTKKGLPIVAVICSSAFAFLSLISISSGADEVFDWFVQLTTIGGFFGWLSINITYIFFYRGLRNQGIDRRKLHYWNQLQPWLSIWGASWCALFILINGFRVFWDFDTDDFVTAYLDILIFVALFLFLKIRRKTELWKPEEMNFTTGIPTYEQTEGPELPPKGFWQHIAAALF